MTRYDYFWDVANGLAEDRALRGDMQGAEHYWTMMAYPDPRIKRWPPKRALALASLAARRLEQSNPQEAYRLASESLGVWKLDIAFEIRAKAALQWVQSPGIDTGEKTRLIESARRDLANIAPFSDRRAQADVLLKDPLLE